MQSSPALSSTSADLLVLVFGPQAHTAGTDRLHIQGILFPVSAGELMTEIAATYPDLAASLGVSRIAINHEFATPDSSIAYGDEVALVGLISGG